MKDLGLALAGDLFLSALLQICNAYFLSHPDQLGASTAELFCFPLPLFDITHHFNPQHIYYENKFINDASLFASEEAAHAQGMLTQMPACKGPESQRLLHLQACFVIGHSETAEPVKTCPVEINSHTGKKWNLF